MQVIIEPRLETRRYFHQSFIFKILSISELSFPIISELMFYVNAVDDIMNHNIKYPNDAEGVRFRDFDRFYQAHKNQTIKAINGVFLTNNLHSLISQEVINLMNTASNRRITYSYQRRD